MRSGVCLCFTSVFHMHEKCQWHTKAQSDSRLLSIEFVKGDGLVRTIPVVSMHRSQWRPWTARLDRCAGLPEKHCCAVQHQCLS